MAVAETAGRGFAFAEVKHVAALSKVNAGKASPDFAEFILGPRYAWARWLSPGYFLKAAL